MLGFFKPKRADVIDHWYVLVPGFNTSSKEFYVAIEKELKERQVPGLEIAFVDFAEGGVLSQKREYLRLTRERLVFDICAAPFGTSYFFSCRFAEIPAVIRLWQLLVVLVAFGICVPLSFIFCAKVFGLLTPFVWAIGWIVLIAVAIYTLRNAVSMGLKDLDAMLIKSPVVGPIYENWFRKETYYRNDTRLMYLDTVNAIAKARVEETTGAKGIKLLRYMENCPILNELYKRSIISLPKEPS